MLTLDVNIINKLIRYNAVPISKIESYLSLIFCLNETKYLLWPFIELEYIY